MLAELTVENYAVVEKVRVRFHRGLNLLTGETGSGKSIVVDALALLYGGRASPEMVRTGTGRARIAGTGITVRDVMGWYKLGLRLEEIGDQVIPSIQPIRPFGGTPVPNRPRPGL